MNGFANAILTLLLSWMRVLVNDLWRLLSSEDAGIFYRFLAANWKLVVLNLCAGGFVVIEAGSSQAQARRAAWRHGGVGGGSGLLRAGAARPG